MSLIIRHPNEMDFVALTALMYEYIVDFYQCPKPPEHKIHQLIKTLQQEEKGIQFLAEENGKAVGFATLYFTYSTTRAEPITIMNDLYVQEAYRGSKAAEKLFKSCQTYSKQHQYAAMTWETARDNARAQRFYEKMGGRKGDFLTYSI
ncbi:MULTISPECIES: GNAT family N-acetyltransferase [Metabacillus]|uniref:GNAT family N-acetyltransferase n=1 Tax=Metabacillus hrfriensis TaxID=3048891 RepID=A0ACD4R620_9BACI|nr:MULTISPECIES: GNAT family N-acetyltransferase [Metabacillus]UAL50445.1 GNAT family N-acetyltransferase [Metabacillus dongyingensis]WHZ55925.1 GNAT family N-acetyltransferase [Metabacillus sp. CT-WN-B3]